MNENRVEFCAWCTDPHNPAPLHHPNGRPEHLSKGRTEIEIPLELHTNTVRDRDLYTIDAVKNAIAQAEQVNNNYYNGLAENLILSGISLISSEYLKDNQFIVSKRVYEAAIRYINEE